MKTAVILLLIVFLGMFLVRLNRTPQNLLDRSQSSALKKIAPSQKSTSPSISGDNPFGVMFANANNVHFAKELGAVYYRPISIFVSKWNGTCVECDTALAKGLRLILTVRNNGGQKQPTSPPNDLELYKQKIQEIIIKYKPVVLIVENEENSEVLFYTGTPQQYHSQLAVACEVAHNNGVKCANGGFVSSLVALLVADDYLNRDQGDAAARFIKTTLGPKLEAEFGSRNMDTTQLMNLPKVKTQVSRGKALMGGYKTAGADYINFHWYVADPNSLETAVTFMEQITGLPAIINEVGQQKNEDPAQVTAVMQKIVDLKLPIAIWFSVDVPGYGEAKSLVDENGVLRPNGEAYKNFIRENF